MAETANRPGDVRYLVQVRHVVDLPAMGPDMPAMKASAWLDVASVMVPYHTKRRAAIRKALLVKGLSPDADGLVARALDEDSAREFWVSAEIEPHLRFG